LLRGLNHGRAIMRPTTRGLAMLMLYAQAQEWGVDASATVAV
jgi:hypothetical protein